MFGKKEKLPFNPHVTSEDVANTEAYLVKELRDYMSFGNDPEYTEMICRIVDALSKLDKIKK